MLPEPLLTSSRTGAVTEYDRSKVAESLAAVGRAKIRAMAQNTSPGKIVRFRLLIV
jgi:hypothetical protein